MSTAGPAVRRRCEGYVEDDTEPDGLRPCPLDLDPAVAAAGITRHPCCVPGRTWCRACERDEGRCRCRHPRRAHQRLPEPPPRPSPAVRAAALRRDGVLLCARPGAQLTHADLDAAAGFRDFLAARADRSR